MTTHVRPLRTLVAAALAVTVAGGCSQGDSAAAGSTGSNSEQTASADAVSSSGPSQEYDGAPQTRAQPTTPSTSADDTRAGEPAAASSVPEKSGTASLGSGDHGDTGSAPEESGTATLGSEDDGDTGSAPADESATASSGSTEEGETDSAPSEKSVTASADSTDAEQTQDYDYPDDPEPAQGVVATLCNLNSDYLLSLRNEDASGQAAVDDDLRLSVLALGDQLSYWESLRPNYPEVSEDVDRAQHIFDLWDAAVEATDNGETGAAVQAMLEADEEIMGLGQRTDSAPAECVS